MFKLDKKYIIEELKLLKSSEIDNSKIVELFEDKILKLKDPYLSYIFASEFEKEANIEAHEQVILESRYLPCCYHFACNILKADVKKISRLVASIEDDHFNREFLLNVPRCDLVEHIRYFANKEDYLPLVELLKSKNAASLRPTSEAKRVLSRIFFETNDPYLNYKIAESLNNTVDITRHAEAVMSNKSTISLGGVNNTSYYSRLFAENVPGAPIRRLRQVVLESGEAEENYYFAKNVPSTVDEIYSHRDVVINSGDREYISKFKYLIEELDSEELFREKIKELTKYIDKCIEEE